MTQFKAPLSGEPMLTVSLSRKLVAFKVRSHEEPLNLALVKLIGFDAGPDKRLQWRNEINIKLEFFSALRLKPKSTLIDEKDWLRWLYKQPFEDNEETYTWALINLVPGLKRNSVTVERLHKDLARFHKAVAPKLAQGKSGVKHTPA